MRSARACDLLLTLTMHDCCNAQFEVFGGLDCSLHCGVKGNNLLLTKTVGMVIEAGSP
jgi:hypothetical protein